MGNFSDQVHITVDNFTQNVIHSELEISQKMADHHYFSFIWHYAAAVVIDPVDQAKALRKYLGSEVIFTFLVNGIRVMAKGIINELLSVDKNGSPDGLYVRGISHTVVLDDMKKSRIYLGRPLQNIVPGILAEGPTEFYQKDAISPKCRKEFKYLAQYNETSFEFLKRIAARYGEWFYFDGMRMQFGQLKTSKVKLVNNSSLENFKIQINMTSHKTAVGAYDPDNAVNVKSASAKTSDGSADSFSNIVRYNQGTINQPDLTDGAHTSNALNKEEIEEMVKLQTAGLDANSVFYSGTSYFPIGLGQVFTVTNGTVEHELLAIEIMHKSQVHGNYSCEFKAIPADVTAPHYTNTEAFAKAETQPAVVTDNNDPEGMGRVCVKFNWGSGINTSDWMRMIQPHSGGNKGFYFIPEIGEEVLVGFEGGNIQRPFVMGTEYNGKSMSGYAHPKNDIKAIHTRSGHIIKFTEDESIIITDKSGNEIHLDTTGGNINITAPETMTFNCKNMNINVGESMNTIVGANISESAGVNKTTSVGMLHSTTVGGDHMLNVTGDLHENIQGNIESHTENDRIINSQKGINSSSEGEIEKHSQKETKLNSAEKSNFF